MLLELSYMRIIQERKKVLFEIVNPVVSYLIIINNINYNYYYYFVCNIFYFQFYFFMFS